MGRGLLIAAGLIRGLICMAQQLPETVVIENESIRLEISPKGHAASLIHKPTGEECLQQQSPVLPLCTITQYRPYDNENFLMFPAKPRTFPSNKVEMVGDTLRVEFQDTYDIAYILVTAKADYLKFSLERMDYRIEDYGVKRKTEIDEFALLQLPLKERKNFGEWLNVAWDESLAVALLGTGPDTRIDAFPTSSGMDLYAGLDFQVGLFGRGAALLLCPPGELISRIARLEEDLDLPKGAESRKRKEYLYSYYELRDVTPENIDEQLHYAKASGLPAVMIYYTDFAKACGHFEWKDTYPGGMEDLKTITGKIKAAGLIPGLHFHYSKVAVTDPYICGGVPDGRMNVVRTLTLSQPLDEEGCELIIEENPEGLRMEEGRRLIQIGNELISYTSFSSEIPYKLMGCKRGLHNSTAAAHDKGAVARLLDVDDWPLFIRVNQDTGIQKEIAGKLGEIYNECGFQFAYFDGAEDVPMPYWYNVSRSQLVVYNEFKETPLFAEGALKSHYGWHILSRGNAFDLFPPEKIRQAMKKYTLRCAEQAAKDFSSVNFGWMDYLAPSEQSPGMQPDTYEYICSKALAWDCPVSLVAKLDQIKAHPRTEDNFRVLRDWEEAKLTGAFSAEEKELLKDPDKEFFLVKEEGKYNFYECRLITSDNEALRAYSFSRAGKSCIVCWSPRGSVEIGLNVENLHATDMDGVDVPVKVADGNRTLNIEGRTILEFGLSEKETLEAFRQRTERQ